MLLQIKVYLIAVLYLWGLGFMLLFPARNYNLSGAKIRTKRALPSEIHYTGYLEYNKILEIADRIAKSEAEVAILRHLAPRTANNRTIIALELRSDKQTKKPGILIVGGLHSMTWAVPNAIIELAERLLYDPGHQTPFFNDYDWYLIPLANPDGMQFTKELRLLPPIDHKVWSTNMTARKGTRPSTWHKNVEREPKEQCFGTNVNRNFAYHWQDDVHKTPDRCSQYYPGKKPFSSQEAQALKAYLDALGDTIHLAIHLHSSFSPKKVHQSSADGRVAGSMCDYISGVVGTDLVYLVKPYFPPFPNYTDVHTLETFVSKALKATLSLVRGWRSSSKLNTLYFFGKEIEF